MVLSGLGIYDCFYMCVCVSMYACLCVYLLSEEVYVLVCEAGGLFVCGGGPLAFVVPCPGSSNRKMAHAALVNNCGIGREQKSPRSKGTG